MAKKKHKSYFEQYAAGINDGLKLVGKDAIETAREKLEQAISWGDPIMTFGNGGSAAITEHCAADLMKMVAEKTDLEPRVLSLTTNTPILTAISNDISYDDIFAKQIKWLKWGDAVGLAVSSSGNSENVIRGLLQCRAYDYWTIALVGFDGGRILRESLADTIIHVPLNNYGMVEDCHQIILHSLAQNIIINNCENKHTVKL
jgi:D-sedoheptulose 7-phosphate isomerase